MKGRPLACAALPRIRAWLRHRGGRLRAVPANLVGAPSEDARGGSKRALGRGARATSQAWAHPWRHGGHPGGYLSMYLRLGGHTALVAGATSGLGAAVAVALGSEGANVVIGGRRGTLAKRRASALPSAPGVSLDMADSRSVEAAVASSERAFGRVVILVLNSGGRPLAAAAEVSEPVLSGRTRYPAAAADSDGLEGAAGHARAGLGPGRGSGTQRRSRIVGGSGRLQCGPTRFGRLAEDACQRSRQPRRDPEYGPSRTD